MRKGSYYAISKTSPTSSSTNSGTPLADHRHLADLSWAWSIKEELRHILALRTTRSTTQPSETDVLQRWDELISLCQAHNHIPEVVTFAATLHTWKQEIINAVLTGASNAASEGINRIQKLDMRAAFGYRNPDNQRRRARVATLRSRAPQQLRTVTIEASQTATVPQPNPG